FVYGIAITAGHSIGGDVERACDGLEGQALPQLQVHDHALFQWQYAETLGEGASKRLLVGIGGRGKHRVVARGVFMFSLARTALADWPHTRCFRSLRPADRESPEISHGAQNADRMLYPGGIPGAPFPHPHPNPVSREGFRWMGRGLSAFSATSSTVWPARAPL